MLSIKAEGKTGDYIRGHVNVFRPQKLIIIYLDPQMEFRVCEGIG